jgi:peptidoglycan hydrolase-like protein with peptidoglycan-binding domain
MIIRMEVHMDTVSTEGNAGLEKSAGLEHSGDLETRADVKNSADLPTLRLGDRGPAVAVLQVSLNVILEHVERPVPNAVAVDGVFGPATEEAVKTIQRLETPYFQTLPAEGVVDALTWQKMGTLLVAYNTGAGRFAGMPTLRTGDRGAEVVTLQQSLNVLGGSQPIGSPLVVDGHFGPRTRSAVRALQALNLSYAPPITADGIVGPNTWWKIATVLTSLGH